MNKGLIDREGLVSNLYPKETEVTGRICDSMAQIEIKQVYQNSGIKAIDTAYIFPVPVYALVTDFHASMGKAQVNGFIMEREEARQAYEKTGGTVESLLLSGDEGQGMPGVALGILPPGEKVYIHISYIQDLEYNGNQLSITIPALMAPDGSCLSPKEQAGTGERIGCKTRLKLWMNMHRRALSYRSPSHTIRVDRQDEYKAVISLEEERPRPDRDFVLICTCREEESCRGTAFSDGNGRGILCLTFVPEFPDKVETGAKDYVFLLDTSDSMTGQRLAMTKSALNIMLRNLSEIDTFRIAAFGSDLHPFAGGDSLPFAQASLDRATEWIAGLIPGGRADVFKALRYALLPENNKKSVIMILTAGRIEDSDDPINYVKHNIGRNRIHIFGTDTKANLCMLKRISRVGRGDCQSLHQDERLEDGALRLFAGITAPVAEKVQLDWTGITAEDVFASKLSNVRDLEPITVLAGFSGPLGGKALLRGNTAGGIFHLALDASDIEQDSRFDFLEKKWAKKKIEYLENVLSYTSPAKYERVHDEIIRLSKSHNIPSSLTSFVAVKVIPDRLTGLPVPRMLSTSRHDGGIYNDREPTHAGTDGSGRLNSGDEAAPVTHCEILRMLARNQQANGAFYGDAADSLLARVDTTALTLIAFMAGKENIRVYRRQLEKSVKYLTERVTNGRITPGRAENIQTLLRTILALKLCMTGSILNQTEEEWILRWIDDIRESAQASLALTGGQSEILEFLDSSTQWKSISTIKRIAAVNDDPSILKKRISLSACEGYAVPALARLGVLEALKQ